MTVISELDEIIRWLLEAKDQVEAAMETLPRHSPEYAKLEQAEARIFNSISKLGH